MRLPPIPILTAHPDKNLGTDDPQKVVEGLPTSIPDPAIQLETHCLCAAGPKSDVSLPQPPSNSSPRSGVTTCIILKPSIWQLPPSGVCPKCARGIQQGWRAACPVHTETSGPRQRPKEITFHEEDHGHDGPGVDRGHSELHVRPEHFLTRFRRIPFSAMTPPSWFVFAFASTTRARSRSLCARTASARKAALGCQFP